MPRGFLGFFLRFLREDGRRRRFIARRRRGAGGLRRFRARRPDLHRFGERHRGLRHVLGVRLGDHHGAGPSGVQAEPAAPPVPEAQPLPAWILAGPAAPILHADEEMAPQHMDEDVAGDDPELAAPPPPPPCPVHGWACPLLGQPDNNAEEEAVPETSVVPASPSPPGISDLPSSTPTQEAMETRAASSSVSLGLRLPAPNVARRDVLDNGASSSATPSQSNRRGRFIIPRAVLARAGAGRRLGEWSPASLGLANGHSNGVVPGTRLPGGSSSEEEDSAPGPSAPCR